MAEKKIGISKWTRIQMPRN